jgi:RNA polymerase sigma factor (sigma-70 family)
MSTKNTTIKARPSHGDSLALYYKDVEGTRLLSAAEERTLIQKFHATKDPRARDLIIQGALRYVIAEARKHPKTFHNRAVLEDLIAAGNIGLIRALHKFDPEAGTRFLTYAGWWVRHEMREEGRRIGVVHIPAHALAKGTKVPITTELTEYTETDTSNNGDAAAQVNTTQSVIKLLVLTHLSIRETFIVKTCYGIHTSPKTLKQIGKVLDITGERVRQLRETALSKLRSSASTHQITI